MKTLFLFLLMGLNANAGLKIGDAMTNQDTKMMSTRGSPLTLREISKGKRGTLVVFSCVHCPYAKAWDSRIATIGADAQSKGLGVVMINSNDPVDYPEDSMDGMKKKSYAFLMS
jgi:hypothetical protein